MTNPSPLLDLHAGAGAEVSPYGEGEAAPLVVQTFGDLGSEYAALRTGCALLDLPQRTVLEVTGPDRLEFLGRMLTQELKGLSPFRVRRSFWLSRKGRIDADLRVIDLPSRTLLEVDLLAAERTLAGLSAYIITEDCAIRGLQGLTHRLALHGPTGMDLLSAVAQPAGGAEASGPGLEHLEAGAACVANLAGHDVVIYREDSAGTTGLELIVPSAGVGDVYRLLLEAGRVKEAAEGEATAPSRWRVVASRVRLRAAGWHAYNVARIEAGTPIYNLDFGAESLPAETGVLHDRVSFTKGCYLGQEIVARMHARGQSKQSLVRVHFERREGRVVLPEAGAALEDEAGTGAVGLVTSSTIAPSLGSVAVALAQVKSASASAGTVLVAQTSEGSVRGTVQASLHPGA